jgi:hypothetical protein
LYHPDLLRHPDSCPALVLNADYTPLSYYPLSLWPWQTAVKAVFLERVDIVASYEREVHSPTTAFRLPSVIALRQFVRPSEYPPSPGSTCSCATASPANIAATRASSLSTTSSRARRAAAPPGRMSPPPAHPATCGKAAARRRRRTWRSTAGRSARPAGSCRNMAAPFPPGYLHDSWRDYLYWDIELEA